MEAELISIIVPVYNAQNYVKECIESIINQTYSNIEILIIDDGSCDLSWQICNTFASHDKIRLYKKENEGVAKARNFGLDRARGKYICFVDSDDYLEKEMISKLYDNMNRFHADIAEIDFNIVDQGIVIKKKKKAFQIFEGFDALKSFFSGNNIENSVCTKMFLKEFIGKTRFQPIKIGEDLLFNYELLLKQPRVVVDYDTSYYNYRVVHSSAMHQSFDESTYALVGILEQLQTSAPDFLQDYFDAKIIREKMKCVTKMILDDINDTYLPVKEQYLRDIKSYPFYKAMTFLSLKHILTLYIMKISPLVYSYLYRKLQKL